MPPRTKQTPQGSRGPFGGRHSSEIASSPSSNIATPNNEYIYSTSSESGSERSPRELPDELIEFVSQQNNVSGPPRKRQKVETPNSPSNDPELEHIVVHQCSWEILCVGSKLSELDTPIDRSDIGPYICWNEPWGSAGYIDLVDDRKYEVFHALIPRTEALEDVRLALLVHQESRKWARLQGRLWTEFGISLYQNNGLDCIELNFTIKWNTTTSPNNVLPVTTKTSALLQVM